MFNTWMCLKKLAYNNMRLRGFNTNNLFVKFIVNLLIVCILVLNGCIFAVTLTMYLFRRRV